MSDLITNLFTDRTNNIIMDGYISRDYDVVKGIDQGETICPLLWVIYYDPMFKAINDSQYPGYTMKQTIIKNISLVKKRSIIHISGT